MCRTLVNVPTGKQSVQIHVQICPKCAIYALGNFNLSSNLHKLDKYDRLLSADIFQFMSWVIIMIIVLMAIIVVIIIIIIIVVVVVVVVIVIMVTSSSLSSSSSSLLTFPFSIFNPPPTTSSYLIKNYVMLVHTKTGRILSLKLLTC